jgi:hypothetical protein
LSLKVFELKAESEILNIELNHLKGPIEAIMAKPKPTADELGYVRTTLKEREIKEAQHTSKINEVNLLIFEQKLSWTVLGIAFVVGSFSTAYGFVYWYGLVQKPQDLLLRVQFRNAIDSSPPPGGASSAAGPSTPP